MVINCKRLLLLLLRRLSGLGLGLGLALGLSACDSPPQPSALDLNAALGGAAAAGFARADRPRAFVFPADHAAHPSFRNEWWYLTGNLRSEQGAEFGYQLTLFRIALRPTPPDSNSAWATQQVWMAHVALTDVTGQQHWHEQRLARGAVGLAGQQTQPFKVWLEDWQLLGGTQGEFPWQVRVQTQEFSLNLDLQAAKAPILQGLDGLSQKSSAPGNASYYYSLPRLTTTGTLRRGTESFTVQGDSWLDREWSTSALGPDQAGWDWFSLQLADQHELMFYRLRQHSGASDPLSAGKWIKPDGSTEALSLADVQLHAVRYWQAASGARYPVEWEMRLPAQALQLRIKARVDDQQMQTSINYWEGAVSVTDLSSGAVLGYGYLELSGYE